MAVNTAGRLAWRDVGGESIAERNGETFTIKFPKKRRTWYALEHKSLKEPQRHETLTGAKDAAEEIAGKS